jgi:pSer/pThr/pTyr-binding forkhead associated (FHA) protein
MTPDNPHGPIRGDRAYLVHAAENQTYAIVHSTFRIGRDPKSHLQVLDTTVSRDHAEVRFEDGKHMLYNLGSSETLVNGTPISEFQTLKEGDEIRIGDLTLLYTSRSPSGAIVTEAGWAEDIKVSEAPTEHARKYEPGSTPRDRPRTAMIIVVSATILLIVWALASLLMR